MAKPLHYSRPTYDANGAEIQPMTLKHRTQKWICTFGPGAFSLKESIVRAENRIHFSLAWPCGSLTRTSGSARCSRQYEMPRCPFGLRLLPVRQLSS